MFEFWSEEKLKLPAQMGSTVWLVRVREDHNRVLHYINLHGSVVIPNKYLLGSHHKPININIGKCCDLLNEFTLI